MGTGPGLAFETEAFAIADTMNYVGPDIETICVSAFPKAVRGSLQVVWACCHAYRVLGNRGHRGASLYRTASLGTWPWLI